MKFLFIHQGFPAQYKHIIRALASQGSNQIVALGIKTLKQKIPKNVQYLRYNIPKGNTEGIHQLALETETKVIRGSACANAAYDLKSKGFIPDIVCAHTGWGEALFIKDVWPNVPILSYQEFFYRSTGFDYGFDPAVQGESTLIDFAKVRMKNAYNYLMLEASDWNVTPTQFQRSTYPHEWQEFISPIHDGIDTSIACPDLDPDALLLPDGTKISKDDAVVTFVNRSIEPYRGCHTFIRAIPLIHENFPDAHIAIVGSTKGVSYGRACEQGEYKDFFMNEIKGQYRSSHVHFTEQLPYSDFLHLLKLSSAHVYLTYPFVLSWSLLEAMSCGCAIVGSSTAPVEEVIFHKKNGLLVDFFDSNDIAKSVVMLLKEKRLAQELGDQARKTIVNNYSLNVCLPQQLSLIRLVAQRALGRCI